MVSKTVGGVVLCLLAGTLASSAKEIKLYGAKGHSIVLPLKQLLEGTDVTYMAWKYNGHIAVDWAVNDERPNYKGIFNSTTTLDMNTWALTISNLQPHFRGKYTAEVNHKDPTESLNLAVIDAVHLDGVKGQSVALEPKVPNVHVDSVEWALNKTVIAWWERGQSKSGQNLTLDSETFSLNISYLQENCSGLYTFKVNHVEKNTVYYLLTVRDAMLELSITKQCNSTICTLNCMGADNESIEVTWTDNKGGKKTGPVWVVEKSPHLNVTYTCTSDSGSWNTKSVSEKELFSDPFSGDTESNLGKILGPVVVAVLVLGVGVTVYWKRKGPRQQHEDAPRPEENPLNRDIELGVL